MRRKITCFLPRYCNYAQQTLAVKKSRGSLYLSAQSGDKIEGKIFIGRRTLAAFGAKIPQHEAQPVWLCNTSRCSLLTVYLYASARDCDLTTIYFLIYIHNYLLNSLCYCILKKGNFIYRNFTYCMLCNLILLRCKSCKTYYYYCHMQLHSFHSIIELINISNSLKLGLVFLTLHRVNPRDSSSIKSQVAWTLIMVPAWLSSLSFNLGITLFIFFIVCSLSDRGMSVTFIYCQVFIISIHFICLLFKCSFGQK